MYKISENSIDFRNYSITIMNENNTSREIKEEIKKSFPSSSEIEKKYIIEINTNENFEALITNTDGTVAKYRIEIIINYKVKDKQKDSYLIEDMVRGFAQYTVETSEIESNDKKNRMIRTATNSAIQMMISKIQSDISITNDN
ncbi:LPS assembly lipoprotein LptE [Pelagibacteraceae bacterium]|nr:LPS assembly lipoprotein LptE [Pelagibacteraceae bacterium]